MGVRSTTWWHAFCCNYVMLRKQIFRTFFPSSDVSFSFLSRFCQMMFLVGRLCFHQRILSEDFCCQQILFLTAASKSNFSLSANVFAHFRKVTLALAYSVSRQSVSWQKHFPPAGAHFCFNHDCIRLPDLPEDVVIAQTFTLAMLWWEVPADKLLNL